MEQLTEQLTGQGLSWLAGARRPRAGAPRTAGEQHVEALGRQRADARAAVAAALGPGRAAASDPAGDDGVLSLWLSPEVRQRLIAFARRFVGDDGEAEDVAQETLMRATTGRRRLRSPSRAEAWLFRICRYAAIDYVRSRRVRRALWASMPAEPDEAAARRAPRERDAGTTGAFRGDDGLDDGLGDGGRGDSAAGAEAAVSAGLASLPAHQRLLMSLYYERGLSQATICRLTGLSPSALRVRLFRARTLLLARSGLCGSSGDRAAR